MEMSYIRGACDVSRWDGEGNDVHVAYHWGVTAKGLDGEVVQWVKHGTF